MLSWELEPWTRMSSPTAHTLGPHRQGALALTGSLCVALMTNSAPLAAALGSRIGSRGTALLGSVIQGAGLALSASATSAWGLYATFAIVGVGQALAFFSAVLLMLAWFDTRLNRVHALANSVAASATLFLGPPAHDILEAVGWRHTLLSLALATTMMLGTASLLLTPPAAGAGGARGAGRAQEPPVRWATLVRSRVVVWLALALQPLKSAACPA